MQIKIFYSWQSDSIPKYNRYLIEQCLKDAIKKISKNNQYQLEFSVDKDTKGVIGTIDITETIFDKIQEAHIFIADITIINNNQNINEEKYRMTPNPNVLIELGFAASQLGWENTICFFNASYSNIESLPFDLRNRRPYIYNLNSNSTEEDIKNTKNSITKDLVHILTAMNPSKVEGHKQVYKEFFQDNYQIQRILKNKPERWFELLLLEILQSEVFKINEIYNDLKEGIIFKDTRIMNDIEFFIWTRESHTNMIKLLKILDKTAKNLMPATTYEEIESDYLLPIKLKRSIKKLSEICFHVIEWRILLDSLEPPKEFHQLKIYLQDWSNPFIIFINDLYHATKTAVDQIRGKKEIKKAEIVKTSFTTLPNIDLIQNIMTTWVMKNKERIDFLKI